MYHLYSFVVKSFQKNFSAFLLNKIKYLALCTISDQLVLVHYKWLTVFEPSNKKEEKNGLKL